MPDNNFLPEIAQTPAPIDVIEDKDRAFNSLASPEGSESFGVIPPVRSPEQGGEGQGTEGFGVIPPVNPPRDRDGYDFRNSLPENLRNAFRNAWELYDIEDDLDAAIQKGLDEEREEALEGLEPPPQAYSDYRNIRNMRRILQDNEVRDLIGEEEFEALGGRRDRQIERAAAFPFLHQLGGSLIPELVENPEYALPFLDPLTAPARVTKFLSGAFFRGLGRRAAVTGVESGLAEAAFSTETQLTEIKLQRLLGTKGPEQEFDVGRVGKEALAGSIFGFGLHGAAGVGRGAADVYIKPLDDIGNATAALLERRRQEQPGLEQPEIFPLAQADRDQAVQQVPDSKRLTGDAVSDVKNLRFSKPVLTQATSVIPRLKTVSKYDDLDIAERNVIFQYQAIETNGRGWAPIPASIKPPMDLDEANLNVWNDLPLGDKLLQDSGTQTSYVPVSYVYSKDYLKKYFSDEEIAQLPNQVEPITSAHLLSGDKSLENVTPTAKETPSTPFDPNNLYFGRKLDVVERRVDNKEGFGEFTPKQVQKMSDVDYVVAKNSHLNKEIYSDQLARILKARDVLKRVLDMDKEQGGTVADKIFRAIADQDTKVLKAHNDLKASTPSDSPIVQATSVDVDQIRKDLAAQKTETPEAAKLTEELNRKNNLEQIKLQLKLHRAKEKAQRDAINKEIAKLDSASETIQSNISQAEAEALFAGTSLEKKKVPLGQKPEAPVDDFTPLAESDPDIAQTLREYKDCKNA